ncbi:PilN domain-containing protein [Crassaminicella indica]|uniref:PilN domain-containing protein n=1 Tax=Crassaminicella indica TaxID=2855394 RepID=A0ABX8RDM5_9CLOT|nr:PilN domain-containing protein [Crassaminicella indica]QXM06005.1 PilN domain-containing protein [Crassaminicella indica]
MKQFNFFEPYLQKKYKKILHYTICGITVLLFIYPFINVYLINKIKKEVIAVNNITKLCDKITPIKKQQEQIKKINKTLKELKKLDTFIKEKDIINDFLLYTIYNNVPQNLFFKSFHITDENVKIEGIAKDKVAIAQFKSNLEEIIYFQDIYIPSILKNEEGYIFTIYFHIGDEKEDETN